MAKLDELKNEIEMLNYNAKTGVNNQNFYNNAYARARSMNNNQNPSVGQIVLGHLVIIEEVTLAYVNKAKGQSLIKNTVLTDYQMNQIGELLKKANNEARTVTGGVVGAALGGAAIGGILGFLGGAVVGALAGNQMNKNDRAAFMGILNQAIDYYFSCLYSNNTTYYLTNNNNDEQSGGKAIAPSNEESTESKDVTKKDNGQFPMFKDVIGLEEAKQAIKEKVIDPSLHPDVYKKYGLKVGGGLLLYGLPGTGKTMFAQAVANEINGAFFSIKASDIKSKWYGESEENIKKLFEEARKNKVSVIFIDEFEAIGMNRSKGAGEGGDHTATIVVPELLAQMQGFEKSENILLVIAATNRPWDIDPALLRPGRFDTKVYVDLPNLECRKAMFKNYLKKASIFDSCIDYLAENTEKYNGSDVKNVSDGLIRIAIDHEIKGTPNYHLDMNDCRDVLSRIKSSVSIQDEYLMGQFMAMK